MTGFLFKKNRQNFKYQSVLTLASEKYFNYLFGLSEGRRRKWKT
jgi:hypothetical protein